MLGMKFCCKLLLLNFVLAAECLSESDNIHVGYRLTLVIPSEYTHGFSGRAFLMETQQIPPTFRAAINVDEVDGNYSCSFDIFLGDVRVWSSGHLSRFYTREKCMLEFNDDGDLRLKGENGSVGWRSGTSGQGVERLHLLRTGNLVLVDALNLTKWQSFNFPTDTMLWGQKLSSQTTLTSFPDNNSTMLFYSFEIHSDRIALYLNFEKWKYSYWEFKPFSSQNITHVQLTSNGLIIFNRRRVVEHLAPTSSEPTRFLSLRGATGNLQLFYYSNQNRKFQTSFQALNFTCDLPLACKPYSICTSFDTCSCIHLQERKGIQPDCSEKVFDALCGRDKAKMVELEHVRSVLNADPYEANVSKEACSKLCLNDCSCAAMQYRKADDDIPSGQCFLYKAVRGIKEFERSGQYVYMVKVSRGRGGGDGEESRSTNWMIVLIVVVDCFILCVVLGGLGFYVVRNRRKGVPIPSQANN